VVLGWLSDREDAAPPGDEGGGAGVGVGRSSGGGAASSSSGGGAASGHGEHATPKQKRVNLHPAADERLPNGAQIVLMSSEKAVTCSKTPIAPWIEPPARGGAESRAAAAGGRGRVTRVGSGWEAGRVPSRRHSKTMLLLNFVDQWELLNSLDTPLNAGTKVILLIGGQEFTPVQGQHADFEFRKGLKGSFVEAGGARAREAGGARARAVATVVVRVVVARE